MLIFLDFLRLLPFLLILISLLGIILHSSLIPSKVNREKYLKLFAVSVVAMLIPLMFTLFFRIVLPLILIMTLIVVCVYLVTMVKKEPSEVLLGQLGNGDGDDLITSDMWRGGTDDPFDFNTITIIEKETD